MMERIPQDELDTILHSYSVDGLSFDDAKQVSPDMTLYFFHDKEKIGGQVTSAADMGLFCLQAADFL